MKEHTGFTENKPLSDNLEPNYATLFEDEHRQWKAEATELSPLGILVAREIAKQQAVRRKRQRYGLVAAVVCILLAVGTTVFYTVPSVRTAATQVSTTLTQHSAEALTGIQQATRKIIQPVGAQFRMAVQALLSGDEAVRWQDDLTRQEDIVRQGVQAMATVADTAKKIAAVVAGWPVQVWYILFLTVGVGLLLAIDFLVRFRKKMARQIGSSAPL
ncbi:MAG: hypothetical protein GX877_06795 [Bacteroidales bacterium]|nr:hypothetical protein [Bacteroidales bacterium]